LLPQLLGEPLRIDRAAERRTTADLDKADAIVVSGGTVLAHDGRLVMVPAKKRPQSALAVFLGRHNGRDMVAVSIDADSRWGDTMGELAPLRSLLGVLSGDEALAVERELAVTAVAMIEWHARNRFCSRCGGITEPSDGGWIRRCVPENHEHYPRTDSAVIVAITDEVDRILLAHVAYHPPGRYSHLAGFLEPGESFEQAAHREVKEESSLALHALEYVGSQPWPFPAAIMVGFRARATAADLKVDAVEVSDAHWFTRDDVLAGLVEKRISLAPPGTIARNLIHDWFGSDPVRAAGVADA
jgi:NAD+ diphosphatase